MDLVSRGAKSTRVPDPRLTEIEAALAREQRVSRALREVGSALGTTLDLDELLELILANLTDLVEADRATLYLLDEATGELVSRVVVGAHVRSIRVKVGHGVAGAVVLSGKPIRIRDAYTDPRFEPEWDVLTGYRTASMLAAPLKNHLGRTIGVIQVLNKLTSSEFSEQDEEMVTVLCTQAAVAIDNSRLFLSLLQKNKQLVDTKEQLERRLRDLVLLYDLERATARADSTESLAKATLSLVAKACEACGAVLLVAEEETGDLVEYVLDGSRPDVLLPIGVRAGEGLLAAVMERGEPASIPSITEDESYSARVDGQFPFAAQSMLGAPLEGDVAPLGAIALFYRQGDRRLGDDDWALIRLVSANVSTALRLYRASEARERSERLTTIGRLLSQVIHDFKTPMTVISGYVQLMQDADDRERRVEFAEEVLKQFDVLTAMQREVLEFARGESRIFVRRVYLKKFFADLQRTLRHEIEGRPIELVLNIDTKLVARFDESRMARAIHNLARNAIEAMSERGGRLTIGAHRDESDLVIRVADTGQGIPSEVAGRLFQSFVTAGKKGGTGLGLAIVRKIVDEHGGTIDVQSSIAGAVFELRIPLHPRESRTDEATPSSVPAGRGRPAMVAEGAATKKST